VQGQYAKALEYHFKSLKLKQAVLGEEHADTATSYSNIGRVYEAQGQHATALEYHLKDLDITLAVLGEENIDTAASYSNIGRAYEAQGLYSKALEYHLKDLDITLAVSMPTRQLATPILAGSMMHKGITPRPWSITSKAYPSIEKLSVNSMHPLPPVTAT